MTKLIEKCFFEEYVSPLFSANGEMVKNVQERQRRIQIRYVGTNCSLVDMKSLCE